MNSYKKEILFLIINYVVLSLMILLMFGCASIPDIIARAELNTCGEVEIVPSDINSVSPVYPHLEIAFDDGNLRLTSSNICFSFYLFNANRDTLYVRDFKVLGKNQFELINLFNIGR